MRERVIFKKKYRKIGKRIVLVSYFDLSSVFVGIKSGKESFLIEIDRRKNVRRGWD